MPVSRYRDNFENESQFEDFKNFSFNFVSQCESLYNALLNQGNHEAVAKQVVYEKMYHPFQRAKNFYDKVKKGKM